MNPRSLRCVLVVLALPALVGACSEHIGQGFDWKRMRVQHRDDPYGSNPAFADGSAMRVVPFGTISRESMPAGSPPPATDLARGQSRFHIFCAVCHGERGDGVSIVASDMDDPRPPSLIAAPVSQLQSAQIYNVITNGFGRMPSFSSQLSPSDRWQVIAYLAELQGRAGNGIAKGAGR